MVAMRGSVVNWRPLLLIQSTANNVKFYDFAHWRYFFFVIVDCLLPNPFRSEDSFRWWFHFESCFYSLLFCVLLFKSSLTITREVKLNRMRKLWFFEHMHFVQFNRIRLVQFELNWIWTPLKCIHTKRTFNLKRSLSKLVPRHAESEKPIPTIKWKYI